MRKFNIILLIFISILFTACDQKEKDTPENEYLIHYINSKTMNIVTETYTAKGDTKETLVNELIYQLRKEPKDMVLKTALPDTVTIKGIKFTDEESLTINLDSSYNKLVGIPEVLCRAAIVKTLCQIDGVEYIEFYVNDQALQDSNGEFIGLLTEDDFIDNISTDTNYKLSLFYANKKGDRLIESISNITYSESGSMEEIVIEQLINGPIEVGKYATIPQGTTLLNITTKDGICYVDFNEKFLDKIPEITDQVAIYSVVNSLVELPNVNKVQFLINGEIQKTYRENLAFDGLFERDLSIID